MSDEKKPFNADNITRENLCRFLRCHKKPIVVHAVQMMLEEGFTVITPSGAVTGCKGDYLVVGARGERYPIKKEIFEATYDVLEGEKS